MGRLVQIEVENFKSYKGHQVIGPFHNFTSVIGPNGSGKSNLMDAISFVLGVHSSHLRSQSVKDMIYRANALNPDANDNNTSSRHSKGPRTAHVTAVYETTQGDQILFKRTAHHTGQSDYHINNRSVSLSEYNTTLETESILVKAKNFLVFQGDVESVASQKPIELTKLVEQISGSWEYKEDYDRLKALYDQAVEANAHALHKKRGIAMEAKQYRQQKEEAENFTRLVQERQEMSARYLLWKLYHVEQKTEEMQLQVDQRRTAADGATEEQLTLEESFKSVRREQALVHRERTRRELQIKKAKRELTEQRPASITIQEKLDHLEKKINQIKQNGLRAERDFEQQKNQVADLEKDMSLLDAEEAKYKDEFGQYNQGPSLTTEQTTTYEQLKQAVSARATKEQDQIATLQQKRNLLLQEQDRHQSKLDQLSESHQQYTADRQQVMDHGQALTEDATSLTAKLTTRQHDLQTLIHERTEIHRREVQLNEQLQSTLNELMDAKVVQHASEKDRKTKESLAMMQQLFGGVHGPLSKLCRPTQRKYGLAVSTLLGRHLDAIVVNDQKTAIDCIQYLREQRAGTATFLPLDGLLAPAIQDRWRQLPRASLAVDVIQCDHLYLPAVEYACGNTVVCDTMDAAKRICYEMNQDVKAVTLDGSILHRSGLITGGPSSSQKTKVWDEKDVDGLMRTRDKLLAELNELSRTKRMGSAEEQAKSDCDGLQSQLAMVQDEIKIAEQKLKDIDSSLQNIQENEVIHEQQLGHTKHAIANLNDDIDRVKQTLAVVEDDVFSEFCDMLGVATIRDFENSQQIPDQIREHTAKHQTQRLRLQTQLSFETEQCQTIQDRLTKLTQSLQEATDAQARQQADLVALDALKLTLTTNLASYEAELREQLDAEQAKQTLLDAIRSQLEEKGKDMDGYIKEMTVAESAVEKVRAERVAIFRRCKLEDIRLPLLSGDMDDVLIDDSIMTQQSSSMDSDAMEVDDLSQRSIRSTDWTVQVDYSALDDDERQDNSSQMDKRFQEDLKRRAQEISQMDPNLKAIDRLDGIEQRLTDLEEEYRTTRKAVETTRTQFDQVKRKRLSLFQAAFTHISENIDAVYKELTKTVTFPLGGTAYLTLEESHEPYLKGLLYHAMPPMKRFRDMDQLSGGEKSMAALALLFAIRSYQPSPFFVLDEVDAALDNTNVKRVVSYIRRHASDQFQFIVISFKNILYERAQSLVGIYRDVDHSSSKSLTLKLDDYEE